jgi:hypothetical protein
MRLLPESPRQSRVGRRLTLCSVLHCKGFFKRCSSRNNRWALTPPFHPYPAHARRYIFCDTIRQPWLSPSVARTFARHAAFLCSDFPLARQLPHQRSSTTPDDNRREELAQWFAHRFGGARFFRRNPKRLPSRPVQPPDFGYERWSSSRVFRKPRPFAISGFLCAATLRKNLVQFCGQGEISRSQASGRMSR